MTFKKRSRCIAIVDCKESTNRSTSRVLMHPSVLSSHWLTATRGSNLRWVHCLQFAASLYYSMFATSVSLSLSLSGRDVRSLFCSFWFQSSGTTCHRRLCRTNCVIHLSWKVSQLCLSAQLRRLYIVFGPRLWDQMLLFNCSSLFRGK